ncbi:MAG: hydrogenase formation protein HypD [Gammaproteobacteria bacterium]|nr:hydrogenase formation protein HypD [Gammaproteobacteria bacterium]
MKSTRQYMADITTLPLSRRFRVLNLCGDHERVIALSDMREALPENVTLLPGPGCPAAVCPEADVYQALRLVERHDVTLLVSQNLVRLPVRRPDGSVTSLREAMLAGRDIQVIDMPIQAVMAAEASPEREMVCFLAGFESLLAPLAGMLLDGLPANLLLLLSGRRAEPLIDRLLTEKQPPIDGLLLPGNRCAVTGTDSWQELVDRHHVPAAVAGYTVAGILAALDAILRQACEGEAHLDNCYRPLVSAGGNPLAIDRLYRVFDTVDGDWRGIGTVAGGAYTLRRAYDVFNADRRYPDYRPELPAERSDMAYGCDCGDVLVGRKGPIECTFFAARCSPVMPIGPCMASEDGSCFLHRNSRNVA